jgi:hypothetical protein
VKTEVNCLGFVIRGRGPEVVITTLLLTLELIGDPTSLLDVDFALGGYFD